MVLGFDRQTERVEMLTTLTRAAPAHRKELIAEYQQRSEAAFAPATFGTTEWSSDFLKSGVVRMIIALSPQ